MKKVITTLPMLTTAQLALRKCVRGVLIWRKWIVRIFTFLLIHLSDVEMDITEPLEILDSDSFSLILDKGTLDCITCADNFGVKTKQMLENIHRILAPGGCYICVSYGRPETRLPYLTGNKAFKW